MIQDAQNWCSGMTQRDGIVREVGSGFRMGNTCTPWQIHVNVSQNQYSIVISLQVNKLKKKKKGRDITLPTKVCLVKAIWFFQWSCMDVRAGL